MSFLPIALQEQIGKLGRVDSRSALAIEKDIV